MEHKNEWIECNLPWDFRTHDDKRLKELSDAFDEAKGKAKEIAGEVFVKYSNELDVEDKKKSFIGQGLNNPGTLIQYKHKNDVLVEIGLIGNFDTMSGTCGCCTELTANHIILYYRVLNLD